MIKHGYKGRTYKKGKRTSLAVLYKKEIIGNITFSKISKDIYSFYIQINNEKYQNRGLESIAIDKAIHILKKKNFLYIKENDKYVYFGKTIYR